MTVWVTGAGGMLGSCIGRQLDCNSVNWVGTDLELDIADSRQVSQFIETYQPRAIINCAAYTNVDAAESNQLQAQRVNSLGPSILAAACRSSACAFVHFSTDYVFGGRGAEPYQEDVAIAPCNVYGATKAEGESRILDALSASHSPWWILRTSWLFGAGRSSFVETMWNLMKAKVELRVVADQVGRPTYVGDLAAVALRIAGIGSKSSPVQSGIWHFANAGEASWFDFACAIRQAMLDAGQAITVQRIVPVSTAEFPRPALRPAYSVLSTKRLEQATGVVPRAWQEALSEYVQQRSQSELR